MESRDMGGFEWVTFLPRPLEGRINCVFDRHSGGTTDIATKGDGL